MRRSGDGERTRDLAAPSWLGEVVSQGPESVVVFDAGYRIVYVNHAAGKLLGVPPAELVGTSALDFLRDEDLERAAANISAVTDGVQPRAGMMQLVRRDGSVIACDIMPMRLRLPTPPDGPGDLSAVALRDTALPDAHWTFITSLSRGRDFGESISVLAEGVSGSVDGPLSVAYDDGRGRQVVGRVPPDLAGVPAPGTVDDTPGTPWGDALASGGPVVRGLDELPPAIRAQAEAIGAAVCVVVPVPDPGHDRPALIVQWAPDGGMGAVLLEALTRRLHDAVMIALEQRHTHDRLVHLALYDHLTGLANRARFFEVLAELRDGGRPYGVCYLDLDGFKPVNDTFGHQRGDDALAACAARLGGAARAGDLVARLGGDEFAVACPGVDDPAVLTGVAERFIEVLTRPLSLGGDEVSLGASVGCALGGPGADPDLVVGAADRALYEAKRSGRGTVRVAVP